MKTVTLNSKKSPEYSVAFPDHFLQLWLSSGDNVLNAYGEFAGDTVAWLTYDEAKELREALDSQIKQEDLIRSIKEDDAGVKWIEECIALMPDNNPKEPYRLTKENLDKMRKRIEGYANFVV